MSENDDGIKSAYELAMERLQSGGQPETALTAEQKEAIAKADEKMRAGIAEVEIMTQQHIMEAGGDAEKVASLKAERIEATKKLRAEAEREKERIRSASA